MSPDRAISAVILLAAAATLTAPPTPAAAVTQLMPGDILVSDAVSSSGALHLLDPDSGTHSLYSRPGQLRRPVGIAIASGGEVVVADQGNAWAQPPVPPKVVRVDPATEQQVPGSTGGLLTEPTGVAVEADGDTLVATRHGLVVVHPGSGAQRPAHGTLTLRPDGSFSYTPAATYHGPDSFSYAARGGRQFSEPATAQLTVTPVNDAPVVGADRYRTIVTAPLLPLVVAAPGVLGNDHDPDDAALTAVAVSGPRHGRLTLRADGSFSYRPHLLYLGEDSFTYQAVDASGARSAVTRVSITVALL